ncbi:RICIN domain-containing protein [Streptomyces viridosporus]|uniref:RICIN domain-containing protein n=1 Tax=Streptomyces viridosporus TaxID=67581 RepID=UPI0036F76CCD
MEYPGSCRPGEIQDLSAFMQGLRELKRCSGLSYRQLEERAAAAGDVLPRSSLSSMLCRDVPPRHDLLVAFVKACGEGERAAEWAEARDRVAGARLREPSTAPVARSATDGPDSGPADPDGPRFPSRRRYARPVLAVVVAGVAGAVLVAAAAMRTSSEDRGDGRGALAGGDVPPAAGTAPPSGWVTVRVARDPDLCLTDGRVRDWRYTPLVAVQRPCDEISPQSTLLEPLGQGLYRIQWHHPDYGKGCLKALTTGSGKGLLEPMDDCVQASLFSVEPSGELRRGAFVLRVDGQGCVGIAGSGRDAGTEAVMQRCDGEDRQVFLIRAVDRGTGWPAPSTVPSTRDSGK